MIDAAIESEMQEVEAFVAKTIGIGPFTDQFLSIDSFAARGVRVCGDCWHDLRPDQYEPYTFNTGYCDLCYEEGRFVHRVSKAEIAAYRREHR